MAAREIILPFGDQYFAGPYHLLLYFVVTHNESFYFG